MAGLPICKGGALGSMPLGAGPLGSFSLGGVFAVVVVSDTIIEISTTPQPASVNGLPGSWTVAPVGLGVTVTVVGVANVIPSGPGGTLGTLWRLTVDPGMTLAVQYLVSIVNPVSDLVRDGCESLAFETPGAAPVVPPPALDRVDEPYDIANPMLVRDAGIVDPPPLGQYQISDIGDIALDNKLQGLRKRLLRRMSTSRNGFFHLVGYGLVQQIKGPVRPSELSNLAVDARIQAEREPEVIRANVSVTQLRNAPNVVLLSVQARTIGGLDVVASQQIDLRPPGSLR